MTPGKRGKRLAIIVTAAGLAGVAACGGPPAKNANEEDGGTQGKRAQSYSGTQDPTAKGPAKPIPGAKEGGTVTVLSSESPATFDPTRTYYLDTMNIMKLVTRAPTQTMNRDGKPVLVPDLAEDLGKASKDYKTWTFTIKPGIKYEDGSEVKAEDFAYSIERQMAQNQLADGATYGLDMYVDGDKYKGPWDSAGQKFKAVEFDNAERTFTVHMRVPFPSFNYYASLPLFTPIPKSKDKDPTEYENVGNLMATGPYKFESYQKSKRVVLVKNKHWDAKTDPARHQYPDKFDFQFGKQDLKIQSQVLADRQADQATIVPNPILAEVYETNRDKLKDRMVVGSRPCLKYTWFDVRKIPLDVRRAIAAAYPIQSVNQVAGGVPGLTWKPATTLMPSITPGWQKFDAVGNEGKGDGNPGRAEKMLKDIGRTNFELSYYYASDVPEDAKVSTILKEKLEKAGFKVKPIGVLDRQMRSVTRNSNAPVNLRMTTWCIDWASGDTVFPAILNGRKANLPGGPVPSYLNVDEVNKEIDRILQLPSEQALGEWGKLDRRIMEKYLPGIPTQEQGKTLLRGSKIGNMKMDIMLAEPDYTQIYVKK